jgi:hypothetical protein
MILWEPLMMFQFLFFLVSSFWGWGKWGLNSGLTKQAPYCLNHTSNLFCSGYFGDGVSQTICLSWPQTSIFLMSASPELLCLAQKEVFTHYNVDVP